MTEESDVETPSRDLRPALFKLKGLAFLIEGCAERDVGPIDEVDCFYGVGLIILSVHDEILRVAQTIEMTGVKRTRKRRIKKTDDPVETSDIEDS